jgi:hypothetical protein
MAKLSKSTWVALAAATCLTTVAPAQTGSAVDSQSGGSDQWAAMKAEAEAQTAAYNAAKAAADARKAMLDAQSAAQGSRLGTVSGQTVVTGISTPNEGTAEAEALLLFTRSTNDAARFVYADLQNDLTASPGRTVLVLTDANQLANADAMQFDVQLEAVRALQAVAGRHYAAAVIADHALPERDADAGGDRSLVAPLTLASTLLDSAAKLGGYFAADYAFGKVSVTEPANVYASAIVAAFRKEGSQTTFIIPSNLGASDASDLIRELAPVQAAYAEVAGNGAAAKARATALRSSAGADVASVVALYDAADASAAKATTAYETLITGLTSVTQNTEAPLVRIVRQRLIQQKIMAGAYVLLLAGKPAAAYYTKKSLWTFLGGPPLYTMGGVSLVYSLYDPATGYVVRSGAIARHGGYRSVRAVERLFR